jgi:ABC-type polar amino acid transport system ATPase subunit
VQFAREIADLVAVMVEGTIIEAGPPGAVLSAPSEPQVRSFLARALR